VNVWLEKYNKCLTCAGFNNVTIKDVNKLFQTLKDGTDNACVQFLDASLVAGSEHLRFAALNALNAFEGQVNISSNLAIEILLYASAQRQIKEALSRIGVKTSTTKVAAVILAENLEQASMILKVVSRLLRGKRDDSVIDLTHEKLADLRHLFGISNAELEAKAERKGLDKQALIDLVIEHMALLVAQR
jgi:tRNA threonylcarbamoyladenosine modification (KEOPS) complex Cgi121 subunit